MIDYSLILSVNYAGKEWTLVGDNYDGLDWKDASPKPTKEELDSLWASVRATDAMSLLRAERNQRLANTDWWASSDLTMTQEQIDYRQALRDITDTYTSLDDVVWPEMP